MNIDTQNNINFFIFSVFNDVYNSINAYYLLFLSVFI